ncbi:MAG: urease accessory protein UreD [Actinomycetota bacterium]|nr:urease accessory protein UreD [Actinomycetota bacterium]
MRTAPSVATQAVGEDRHGMKAELEIRLHASAGGRVDASGRLAAAPLWCRWDGDTLWIVGSAASPVGQDDVRIRFEVGAGVHARVRTVAAMVLYAARGDGSSLHTEIHVGPDASLHWAPEPVIITGRADHRSTTLVEVAAGSRVTVDELVVDGRNDDDRGGRLVSELGLSLDGLTSLRSSFDTATPGWNGPGGTDGARCLGTRLAVGHPVEVAPTVAVSSACAGLLRPERGGLLAVAVADDPGSARSEIERLLPMR